MGQLVTAADWLAGRFCAQLSGAPPGSFVSLTWNGREGATLRRRRAPPPSLSITTPLHIKPRPKSVHFIGRCIQLLIYQRESFFISTLSIVCTQVLEQPSVYSSLSKAMLPRRGWNHSLARYASVCPLHSGSGGRRHLSYDTGRAVTTATSLKNGKTSFRAISA